MTAWTEGRTANYEWFCPTGLPWDVAGGVAVSLGVVGVALWADDEGGSTGAGGPATLGACPGPVAGAEGAFEGVLAGLTSGLVCSREGPGGCTCEGGFASRTAGPLPVPCCQGRGVWRVSPCGRRPGIPGGCEMGRKIISIWTLSMSSSPSSMISLNPSCRISVLVCPKARCWRSITGRPTVLERDRSRSTHFSSGTSKRKTTQGT